MKKRFFFLDIMRALAIAEMINGHSLDALLNVSLRTTPFFLLWTSVRSFTAPVFLFTAGFAFALSTLPRIDEYARVSKRLVRRLSRLFLVIIVGYALHLPIFSLQKTIESFGSPAWFQFLSVDILQCIGVSLLFLQIWHFARPKEWLSIAGIGMITVLIPFCAPLVVDAPWLHSLPEVIRLYFIRSRFPLVPFASYLFFGFLLGNFFVRNKHNWSRLTLKISGGLLIMSLVCRFIPGATMLPGFLFKSALIALLTVVLFKGEHLWRKTYPPIISFGQESFIVYVVHLMVIYGSPLNKGLSFFWGPVLSYGEVYAVVVCVLLAMVALAWGWHAAKEKYPTACMYLRYSFYLTFIFRFITRPY